MEKRTLTDAEINEARAVAYEAASKISLEGGQVRTDIALKAARGEIVLP